MSAWNYAAGALRARQRLGVKHGSAVPSPTALREALHGLATPAISGAALGGIAGAMTADEGHGGQGALLGAGLGALGAAGGTLAGRATNKRLQSGAANEYAQALHEAYAPVHGKVAPALTDIDHAVFNSSPKGSALMAAVNKAHSDAPMHEHGFGALGGVLGTGAAMTATPKNDSPRGGLQYAPQFQQAPQRVSQYEDPYGYGYTQ